MKRIHGLFTLSYGVITLLFAVAALSLIVFAGLELWQALAPGSELGQRERFNAVLESIGLLTIAVAALELGQTILEEEVQRGTQISLPTRIRRFLSRFMIVIIVSLSIEFLVAVFQLIHDDPAMLPQAASIGIATAILLASWGFFIKMNRAAEELEPEGIEKIKQEDAEIE
ncbi:MAG TPA: hypothetical protein VF707_05830 [Ardenticatenaceae bacterium]